MWQVSFPIPYPMQECPLHYTWQGSEDGTGIYIILKTLYNNAIYFKYSHSIQFLICVDVSRVKGILKT